MTLKETREHRVPRFCCLRLYTQTAVQPFGNKLDFAHSRAALCLLINRRSGPQMQINSPPGSCTLAIKAANWREADVGQGQKAVPQGMHIGVHRLFALALCSLRFARCFPLRSWSRNRPAQWLTPDRALVVHFKLSGFLRSSFVGWPNTENSVLGGLPYFDSKGWITGHCPGQPLNLGCWGNPCPCRFPCNPN